MSPLGRDVTTKALPAVLVALVLMLAGCAESKFTLDEGSRLPRWLSLPAGMARSDVTVTVTHYTPFGARDDALVELRDHQGRVLSKITGRYCWHPVMAAKKNKYGGFNADAYPMYGYIRTQEGIEVFEHRVAGPIVWVSDDPLLWQQAVEAATCDIG